MNFKGIIIGGKLQISDKTKFNEEMTKLNRGSVTITIKRGWDPRTLRQNNALHQFFRMIAKELNERGLTIEKVIRNSTMENDWTTRAVKENLWRPAQKIALGKVSTTELSKYGDIEKVWEVMNRFLADCKVESIPFPNEADHMKKVGELIANHKDK